MVSEDQSSGGGGGNGQSVGQHLLALPLSPTAATRRPWPQPLPFPAVVLLLLLLLLLIGPPLAWATPCFFSSAYEHNLALSTMDGLVLLLFGWFLVSILCYYFILAYNRRRYSLTEPAINVSEFDGEESRKKFLSDLAHWLLWGPDESVPSNEQRLAPAFAKFATKALNEAARRIHREEQPEVRFEQIQLRDHAAIQALHNLHIHPNRTPGTHLSINGEISLNRRRHGPICLRISVFDPAEERQFHTQAAARVPILKSPSIRQHTLLLHELQGDVQVRLASIAGELFVIGCFKERPQVQLELQEAVPKADRVFLEDFVRRALLGAVLNFSIGELLYPDGETSARASRARLSAEYRNLSFLQEVYPLGTGAAQIETSSRMSPRFPLEEEERSRSLTADLLSSNCLRIQLLEANELEVLGADERPFVCIELDEPSAERFLSSRAHLDQRQPGGSTRVFWQQGEANFEFMISPASGELLFEVFSEQEDNSYSTVRQRRFLGMAILSITELRQIIGRQRGDGLVRLQLQGRPEFGHRERRAGAGHPTGEHQTRGTLVLMCTFHHRPVERPSAPQPDSQSPFMAAEYAQIKRRRTPSTGREEEAPVKKLSTVSSNLTRSLSGKRQLPRQKQHYIYNVTEDRLPFEYESSERSAGDNKRSPSKISFDTVDNQPKSSLSPARPQQGYEEPGYSTIERLAPGQAIRKTISDNNALFQFDQARTEAERKRSAPETPVMATKVREKPPDLQMPTENGTGEEAKENGEANANDVYEHLFNGKREGTKSPGGDHPAMAIFKVPEKLRSTETPAEELERRARERDRSRGRKQRRNFFEQIRARLSGPVRLLPGKQTKRAKSLDDYEQPHLEEVASMPSSRDPSQTRYGHGVGNRKVSGEHMEPLVGGQHLFVKSAGPSSTASSTMLHSPQSAQQHRTFSYAHYQLILELMGPDEEGPRYYSIPAEVATEPAVVKLMQSGKKLHVHNAHILVASKSRGRVICSICGKRIGGNFSNRQAYQCRDCRVVCHKNCHRRIDWLCENSAIFGLHVEEVDWAEFLRHHQLREFISVGNL